MIFHAAVALKSISLLLLSVSVISSNFANPKNLSFIECEKKEADFALLVTSMIPRTRIFLVGDSLIGQLCRDSKFCSRKSDGTLDMVDLKPNHTHPSNWSYLRAHKLRGVPEINIYHFGQYGGNVYVFEKEIYWTYKPREFDLLVVLFGAHFHTKRTLEEFVLKSYQRLAVPFPGRVLWLEPFPQHFSKGIYDKSVEDTTPHIDCYPMSSERNQSQFWKVETIRSIVNETQRITLVPTYDLLASFHNCHKEVRFLQKNGNRDCTHYNNIAYSHVWRQISYALLK